MRKGILFSLMAFLLLLSLIAVKTINTSTKSAASMSSVELLAFNSVDERYDDILMNAVVWSGFGGAEEVKERILPFGFEIDQNTFKATQTLPVKGYSMQVFFDAMNSFEVWLKDTDYNNFFTGLIVDVNTPKNIEWGGTKESAEYYLLPQCIKYKVFDQNTAGFETATDCESSFSISEVKRYDVNVFLETSADFNSVSCLFDSNNECPQEGFDAFDLRPFVEINFLDENCTNCAIGPSLKKVSAHYNPLALNSVALECVGASCISPDFNITILEAVSAHYEGNPQLVIFSAEFFGAPKDFVFNDFNFSVENPQIMLKKSLR